ncbi:glycosyltransferase [Qipengyuania atrilutea]|uniref:Glycosyltransferase family 2 protein n=1 Tax=Qipengyuania atrilutea TaxID=2744473 RepID=A0A850H558_9SPHN|nr:glycosyltransferase family 2 protein [Actirhodobacter atriluteus]NVD45312.1 glycosyltransferase family 2 protein [Actirhodobacter atriluteus]
MSGSLSSDVGEILNGSPFAGQVHAWDCDGDLDGPLDYAIAVPARDEEALISRAVDALVETTQGTPLRGGIVVVLNDTQDNSASIVRSRLREAKVDFALIEVRFEDAIRNAPHARRLALDIAVRSASDGVLLTTDADSYVGPGWLSSRLAWITAGYDLVCEDVRLDEAELSLLPAQVRTVGEAERTYFEASERLWRKWTGNRAGSFAHRASGASLAIKAQAYRSIGGLPTPPVGEDVALCESILAAGMQVCTANDGGTRTSARLSGRAQGGCGACLTMRSIEPDPSCDPALVPLSTLREWAEIASRFPATHPSTVSAEIRRGAGPLRPMTYSQILGELEQLPMIEAEKAPANA